MKIGIPVIVEKDFKYLVTFIPTDFICEENLENESDNFVQALRQTFITFDKSVSPNSSFAKRNHGKEVMCLDIDIDTGKILNWSNDSAGEIYIKVVDEGLYRYLDNDRSLIHEDDSEYVPSELQLSDEGYGDYICLYVDNGSFIKDWYLGKYAIDNRFRQ